MSKSEIMRQSQNIFLINGVTSLLGWNVVLGSLDYFNNIYVNMQCFLYFPIPVFIAYCVTSLTYHRISKLLNFQILISLGICGLNASLVLLLAISIIFENNIEIGFYLSWLICFIIGFCINMIILSNYRIVNYFGDHTLSKFNIGTGISGVSVILLRAIITYIAQQSSGIKVIIFYFALAVVFNFIDLYCNHHLFKSKEGKQKIQVIQTQQTQQKQSQIPKHQTNVKIHNEKHILILKTKYSDQTENHKSKYYFQILFQSVKATSPYSFYIMLNMVITFMLFPNLSLIAKTTIGPAWSSIMIILCFNLGDFIGKLIGDRREIFNNKTVAVIFYGRLFFFYTIRLLTKKIIEADFLFNSTLLVLFNQFLFGFTNGLISNVAFILAFQIAPAQKRKYVGVASGIILQVGIMIGSLLAIPFYEVAGPDSQ